MNFRERQDLIQKRDDLIAEGHELLNSAFGRPLAGAEEERYNQIVDEAQRINLQLVKEPDQRAVPGAQPAMQLPNTPLQNPEHRFGDGGFADLGVMPGTKLLAFANNREGRERAHMAGRWFAATLAQHEPSMRWLKQHGITAQPQMALAGGVGTAGGALVPLELSSRIIELMDVYGSFRANADNLPMSSDTLTVPRRVGGLVAYYTGENTAGTESDAEWDDITFTARKLMVLTRMSSEINEDAIISLGDKLTQEISYAFSVSEDNTGFNGTGTSTYGGHTGVLVKAIDGDHTKANVAAASGHDTLPEINSSDLISLLAAVPAYAKVGAKWYCSSEALAAVFNAIQIAASGNSMQNLANAVSPSFLGFPIVTTPVMADSLTTNYNGAVMIAFGNLAMAATVATRRDVRVAISTDAYFELDQIAVKGTLRHSIVAHDLGSTTVKSPFCVLTGTT